MQFSKQAEILSVVPNSFTNDKGETINYFTSVLLVDGEVVEVNTSNKEKYQILKDNLRKTVDLEFKLYKNRYGTYKLGV